MEAMQENSRLREQECGYQNTRARQAHSNAMQQLLQAIASLIHMAARGEPVSLLALQFCRFSRRGAFRCFPIRAGSLTTPSCIRKSIRELDAQAALLFTG